jgi:hypothetical protein
MTPALLETLAHDLLVGSWSPPVLDFWRAAITGGGVMQPTVSVLAGLQRDFRAGTWGPVTTQVVEHLVPEGMPVSVRKTLQRDFRTGTFGPVSRHLLERL